MSHEPQGRSSRENLLRNLVLLSGACLSGLLLTEGLARIYVAVAPTPEGSVFLPDPDAGYRLRPDPPEIYLSRPDEAVNALGFRDRPRSKDPAPGVYRVLGVGDSFVYGSTSSLEEHFLRIAERCAVDQGALEGSDDDSLEILLMGVGGYSPENEVGLLRSVGLDLEPDLVLLNFFVGNDVTGIPVRTRVVAGRTYVVGSPYPWLNALRKSMLFVLGENLLLPRFRGAILDLYMRLGRSRAGPPGTPTDFAGSSDVTAPSDTAAPVGGAAPREPGASIGTGVRTGVATPIEPTSPVYSPWYLHAQLKDLPVYERQPSGHTERLWDECLEHLDEFDRLCRQAGVPWALHLLPADVQVDPPLRAAVLAAVEQPADRYDFDGPQRRLRAWAGERGIPCHDPLSVLRAAHDPEAPLYRVDDIHWTARGNRVAGESLGAFLAERIPAAGPRGR